MTFEKIKFAVVGCGKIGKRHIQVIENEPEAELTAICDIQPTNYKTIPFFSSLEELLTSLVPFDVVCICTPNGLHTQQALQVLQHQKHVVIEKPMGLTKASCEAVIHQALNSGKQVFCVMQNRYSPPIQLLKKLVEEQKLGEIFLVQINCFWNRDERYYTGDWHGTKDLDGGILYTQFAHFIDIMYWLFGDIKKVKTQFQNFTHQTSTEFADTGVASFQFEQGGIGNISFTTTVQNQNFESSITIISSKGTVKIGGQYMNEITHFEVENYTMPQLEPTNAPNQYGNYQGSAANHHHMIKNVIDVLKGRNPITTNALEGMKVVEIIQKIYNG